jgi:hypothetical protein
LFVKTPLHPPLAVVEARNAAYASSTVAWLEQTGTVTLVPQLKTTGGEADTVNVFVQLVNNGAQLLA